MTNTSKFYPTLFNNDDISNLMTVPELADYLGVGRNKAYDLLKSGTINGFRIGSAWKVSKAAVDKYIYEKSGLQ